MSTSFSVSVDEKDWDNNLGGWRCNALIIPGAIVGSIFFEGNLIDPKQYSILGSQSIIRWATGANRPKEILVIINLSKELENKELSLKWRKLAILLPFVAALLTAFISAAWPSKENSNEGIKIVHDTIYSPNPYAIETISDINALWTPLFSDLRKTNKESEKQLDLLGITLYAAWGQLKPWLLEETTQDWEINIYCLSPRIARSELPRLIPDEWTIDAENKTKQIYNFVSENDSDLNRRNIVIKLFHYDFLPTIHGWKLGIGKIYLSMTEWSTNSDKLGYNSHPYEVIYERDTSKLAEIKRNWFNNWLRRARKENLSPPNP